MTELDPEKQEILDAFGAGTLRRTSDAEATRARHRTYVEAAVRKDARINIRIASRDLRGLQKKALAEGMPHQTLAASILHKYLEGWLRETGD